MALLFSDEQLKYSGEVRLVVPAPELFRRPQQCPPFRLFAELECRDRASDALPFIRPQNIGMAALNTPPAPGVMFEVIQPYLEFPGSHSPALLIAYTECASSFGYWRGGIRADCGNELAHPCGDLVRGGIECEMAGLEHVNLGAGHLPPIGFRLG